MDKGLKVLINTYWGSNGWRNGEISSSDFEMAKCEGYMFDYPTYMNHDETLHYAKDILNKIDPKDIANSFLFSLSTRKLEYRSALGSFYYLRSIPLHNIESHYGTCSICGYHGYDKEPDKREKSYGLNVLNFERYKWGGVRHDKLDYALFDLEQFILLPKVNPCKEDINIFTRLLSLARQVEPNMKIGAYSKLIVSSKILKTNKSEVNIMLGLLGMCDVFNSEKHKGYLNCFTNDDGSRDPVEYKNDFAYPVNMWHGHDGINTDAISQVFGINNF